MSEEEVFSIEGGADGTIARLVSTLDGLPAAMPDYVLVGGLAVIVRLAGAHRVTRDVDAVVWSPDGTNDAAVAVLVDAGAEGTKNGARFEGVEIDVIATGDFAEEDVASLDEYDRAFIASHRWAFDAAERAEIVVSTRGGVRVGTATSLATPPALVAMKLGAIPRRKLANPAKRASDLYDIYRLTERGLQWPTATPVQALHVGENGTLFFAERSRISAVEPASSAVRWSKDVKTHGAVRGIADGLPTTAKKTVVCAC